MQLKELNERALRYGVSMARKAGGGLRPHIQASNSYEKRRLPEVVHPDDSGIGFAEVNQSFSRHPLHQTSLTDKPPSMLALAILFTSLDLVMWTHILSAR